MAPSVSSPLPSSPSVLVPVLALCADLQEIGARLQHRGWEVEVVCGCACGDVDVRLHAGHPGAPVVELLGPCGDALPGECWQAVRIATDRRVVWCGPPRPCPVDAVVRFVDDLLRHGVGELVGHYTRLG